MKASKQTILNEDVTILRLLVKMYTFGKTSITCLPDIHKFSSLDEINQIPPVLWNFLFIYFPRTEKTKSGKQMLVHGINIILKNHLI